MNKIILVDGNNLLFRSFYATAYQGVIMKNSKGFPTNALYGFINMMHKIIEEEAPSYIMVAFDKGKTFRHDKYVDYKAGRSEMPDELRLQFPKAKEVLEALGIKYFEIDNYEADDIIGTLSLEVENRDDFIATIISSDKDLLQLVSDKVVMKLLKQSGHIMMTKEEFEKTYQVPPIRMIDLKSLMGDPSDHIPGVKGIGEKTAINLLSKFNSLDNLYNRIDEVTGKTKEKLENDKENAYMSYDLATIYREVPLGFTLDDCKYTRKNTKEFKSLLEEFEFHSLLKKFHLEGESNDTLVEVKKESETIKILPIDELKSNTFSFYVETRGSVYSKSEVLGVGFYDGISGYFLSKEELENYKSLFSGKSFKYTYDLKKSIVVLSSLGIDVNQVTFDTMIATYLLDYVVKDDISFVAQAFDVKIPLYDDLFGSEKRPKEVSLDVLRDVCCQKAKFIYDTRNKLLEKLEKNEELELFQNIEMPLSRVLADMELTGIKVDVDYLDKVASELKSQMDIIEKEIYELAGVTFNIMSPAQLSKVLFETLEIPYPKRTKDGKYSTSKDILDKIRFVHPIVDKILEYRTLAKLYTNYAVGLKSEVREDGRIHTIFTQTLTRTGRLSSISPNLQNIPARAEYSKLIRKAFIPDDNSKLLSSDYSQVELRIFAHMSKAENLIQAFVDGKDIHTKTASDIFHVPMCEVTKDMRRTAKAVNFGILYGISSFGLSEDLGIDIATAKKFIDNYLETYPGISEYMEEEKKKAYEFGYVTTLMNRRRVIEELKNKNYMIRSSGERMALNTPIQGTAADILKKAMVEIYEEFNKRGLKSKMLIQVHDELVFNVLNDELDEVSSIVKNIMENTMALSVPLKVDIEYGDNWYEAK
ncbi:MAG: DNA polymerase I [Candidatus Faecimonas sp.]|nr:DNA polymerase I [Candidatus Faecimonas sp.]